MGLQEALQASRVCPQREPMAKAVEGGVLRGRKLAGPLPGPRSEPGPVPEHDFPPKFKVGPEGAANYPHSSLYPASPSLKGL